MIAEFNAQTLIGASDVIRQSHCPNAERNPLPWGSVVMLCLMALPRFVAGMNRHFSPRLPLPAGAPQKNNNPVN